MTTATCCWCAARVCRLTDGLCDGCLCQRQATADIRVAIEAYLQDSLDTRVRELLTRIHELFERNTELVELNRRLTRRTHRLSAALRPLAESTVRAELPTARENFAVAQREALVLLALSWP